MNRYNYNKIKIYIGIYAIFIFSAIFKMLKLI